MRQTVTNMIGTLPPQFFAVTVTTVSYFRYYNIIHLLTKAWSIYNNVLWYLKIMEIQIFTNISHSLF